MTLLQQQQDTKSKKNVNLFYVCLMELSYFFLEHWRATPTCGRKHKNEFTFIFLKILFFLFFTCQRTNVGHADTSFLEKHFHSEVLVSLYWMRLSFPGTLRN